MNALLPNQFTYLKTEVNKKFKRTSAVTLPHFLFIIFIILAALMSNVERENQALLFIHKPC